MIHCQEISQWSGVASSIITALAAVVGVVVASMGLGTWRRQLRGKVEYDTARRVLRAVLEVREDIRGLRAAFISVGEMLSAFKEAGIDPETVELPADPRTDQLVYSSRWKPLSNSIIALESEVLEAEVLWGSTIREAFGELRGKIGTLRFAVEDHLRRRADPSQWRGPETDSEKEQLGVLHSLGREDVFAKELEQVIAKFEVLLRPHLTMKT